MSRDPVGPSPFEGEVAAPDELAEPWASMKGWHLSCTEYHGGVYNVSPTASGLLEALR